MCILTITQHDDLPESHCSECDMVFTVIWDRSPIYTGPEYCPFCGDAIEEVVVKALE